MQIPAPACTLCTLRPKSVTVALNLLADLDYQDTLPITFRRGPKGRGRKVSLLWNELCDGCSEDLIDAKNDALDLTDEGVALLDTGEGRGELPVTLDWDGLTFRHATVAVLRD